MTRDETIARFVLHGWEPIKTLELVGLYNRDLSVGYAWDLYAMIITRIWLGFPATWDDLPDEVLALIYHRWMNPHVYA